MTDLTMERYWRTLKPWTVYKPVTAVMARIAAISRAQQYRKR